MDISAILDWVKVMSEAFWYMISKFWTPEIITSISPWIIKTILLIIMLVIWVAMFYYYVLPLLTTSIKSLTIWQWEKSIERQQRILALLPKKTWILYWFIFFSIFYFITIFSIISYLSSDMPNTRSYAISNSVLLVDKDEDDETKKELLSKSDIDITDTDGVYSDKLVTPDTTYELYIKQNYPDIKIPIKGKFTVCKVSIGRDLNCTDNYSYKIVQNLGGDKNWSLKLEINDTPILLQEDNGDISSKELKEILLTLQKASPSLLSLYNEGANWVLSFHNKDKATNVLSPGAIHILYTAWRENGVWNKSLVYINNLFHWLGSSDNIIQKTFYPRIMEWQINFPKDEIQQIRTYSIDGLRATYLNILPYKWAWFSAFISDLKSKWFDTNKIITAIFGGVNNMNVWAINNVNNSISKIWSDTNTWFGIVIELLTYFYYFIILLYQFVVVFIIVYFIIRMAFLYVDIYEIADKNDDKLTFIEKFIDRNNPDKDDKINIFIKLWLGIVLTYILGLLYIIVMFKILDVKFVDYSTAWMYFILAFILWMFIAYHLADTIHKLLIWGIRKAIMFIKERTIWKE